MTQGDHDLQFAVGSYTPAFEQNLFTHRNGCKRFLHKALFVSLWHSLPASMSLHNLSVLCRSQPKRFSRKRGLFERVLAHMKVCVGGVKLWSRRYQGFMVVCRQSAVPQNEHILRAIVHNSHYGRFVIAAVYLVKKSSIVKRENTCHLGYF